MHTLTKIGLMAGGLLLTSMGVFAWHKQEVQPSFSEMIQSKIIETLHFSKDIPGLKTDELEALKPSILMTLDNLMHDGVLDVYGTDKEVRPTFVALQGIIEHVLASELNKNILSSKGFIHTPMPATPLCTKGEISKELVDGSIESDPARLFTVKARTTILRDYLFKGGDLFIVYPQEGLNQRTEEQRKIYAQELENYREHLFDVPLNISSIPLELIGATYLFQDQSGHSFVFSIKMTQAKNPQDIGNFGLWFGPLEHPAIQERIKMLTDYLENKVEGLSSIL